MRRGSRKTRKGVCENRLEIKMNLFERLAYMAGLFCTCEIVKNKLIDKNKFLMYFPFIKKKEKV